MSQDRISRFLPLRIAERLEALGLTERSASLEATGQPDALRFIRTRGTTPSATRLIKIAKVLQATPEYLTGETDTNEWDSQKAYVSIAASMNEQAEQDFSDGRIVPVIGAVGINEEGEAPQTETSKSVTVYKFNRDILAFAAAPLGAEVGKYGAFYPADSLMAPVYEPHVPAVFSHDLEAEIGDYALIFFKGKKPEAHFLTRIFALRRIVDRGEGWVTVEQHSPPGRAKLSAELIHTTRKVLSLRDYVAPPRRGDKISKVG